MHRHKLDPLLQYDLIRALILFIAKMLAQVNGILKKQNRSY